LPRNSGSLFRLFSNALITQPRHAYWLALTIGLAAALSLNALALKRAAAARQMDNPVAVVTVPAASFELTPVAPDAIVSAFGTLLATQVAAATSLPLPTTLGGTTVEVNGRPAGLLFVSAGQINYIIPSNTEIGLANVVIRAGDGTVSRGTVQVGSAAPAVFTASSDGTGVPAALVRRFRNNQELPSVLAGQLDAQSKWIPRPIDLGPEGDIVFLELYLSGIRHAPDPNGDGNANESVHLVLGGVEIVPLYAGAQGSFVGLDQLDAEIPRSLLGRGKVSLSIIVTGVASSKLLEVEIAGAAGNAPPQVTGFNPPMALAGQPLTITGSGFDLTSSGNLVRIAGIEARVASVSSTQISISVPFGAQAGAISVRTPQGEGLSAGLLAVRTSISGFVENTSRQPLSGVVVKLSGTNITAVTGVEGSFILPDVPAGAALVEVDGGTVQTTPPFPKVTLKTAVTATRDNQFSRPIALQQATGVGVNVGADSFTQHHRAARAQAPALTADATIQTGNVILEVPGGAAAQFPDGSTSGTLTLTLVENSVTPVDLPPGQFSSAIAQISPFGVRLTPGGKLTFPNPDGIPAGTPATLFRLDQRAGSPTIGQFIAVGTATVSSDGQRIETAPNAITETSYYFVSAPRQTTTVVGRVVESSDGTPVRLAVARARGQEAFTDGNGSFILRNVAVSPGDQISVEASFTRANGRVDRVQRSGLAAVAGGITKVPTDMLLPSETSNRPPTLLTPLSLAVNEGETRNLSFIASDPDIGQTIQVTVSGANFATIIPGSNDVYTLRLAPKVNDAGTYTLTVTALDNQSASTIRTIALKVNRPPTANAQSLITNEDVPKAITLTGSDPDGDPISFIIVSNPSHGSLNGTLPNLTYTPAANYNGSDSFTFKVNDGVADSAPATISLAINPINDAPVLTVPGSQTVGKGSLLSFVVTATDVDGDALTFTATNLPGGATFTPSSSSAQFSWTPNATQLGNHTVTFTVSDNGTPVLSHIKTVTIVVNGQWTQTAGPEGGFILGLLVNGATVLAGTESGGIHRSTDSGQNWTPSNTGIVSVTTRAFAMIGPAIFAGTVFDGVYRSTDGGQNWTNAKTGLTNLNVQALAVSSTTLFAGTGGGGVFRSTDQGQSWTAVNTGLTNLGVQAIIVSGTTLFAGSGGGVFRSTDQGQSWTAVNTGLTNLSVQALIVSGTNIFAGTFGGGAYRSSDQGQNWTQVNTGLTAGVVYSFGLSGTTLFAGSGGGGIYRTTNDGATWTQVNTGFPHPNARAFAVNGSSVYVGAGGSGVFLSTNNGQSWTKINTGLRAVGVNTLIMSGTTLLAGTHAGGIFRSSNQGQSWEEVNTGLGSLEGQAFALNGTDILAGTQGGIFRSTDQGQNWTAINTGLTDGNVLALLVSGQNMFAGTASSGIFRSTNQGQSWSQVNTGLTNLEVRALTVIGGHIFAGTRSGGLFRSTDNGQSWTPMNTGLTNLDVRAFAVIGTTLYAGTGGGGVFRSTDEGQSWTPVNAGLTQLFIKVLAVNGGTLFAGTANNGVFSLPDQGQSWTANNVGLTDTNVLWLIASGSNLFAGTLGTGVFINQ
jgi:uncharacterized protein (TIGR03437 family)